MRFFVFLLFLALSASAPRHDNEWTHAMSFLRDLQGDSSAPCPSNGSSYAAIHMHEWGGFAAQFQQAAAEWIRAASHYNYTIPVLLTGKIRGYSDTSHCNHVKNEWSCYFQRLSPCHDHLISSGVKRDFKFKTVDETTVPLRFAHMGLSWWWGVVQSFLFRLQPEVQAYIDGEAKEMRNGKGFPYGSKLIGIHVRHGDKSSDGFKDHSLEAEMAAARKSPECTPLPNGASNSSSSGGAAAAICGSGDSGDLMPVFVASDDAAVLNASHKLGYLVDKAGVSQQTSGVGMLKTLVHSKKDIGHNASLEIITDIYFLSKCTTLVGIAASQVYRMAVAMSNATGSLRYAAAMDYAQIHKIRQMSIKYHVPFPEADRFNKP